MAIYIITTNTPYIYIYAYKLQIELLLFLDDPIVDHPIPSARKEKTNVLECVMFSMKK